MNIEMKPGIERKEGLPKKFYATAFSPNGSLESKKLSEQPEGSSGLEITMDPNDPTKATFAFFEGGDGMISAIIMSYDSLLLPAAKITNSGEFSFINRCKGLITRSEGEMEFRGDIWHVIQKAEVNLYDTEAEAAYEQQKIDSGFIQAEEVVEAGAKSQFVHEDAKPTIQKHSEREEVVAEEVVEAEKKSTTYYFGNSTEKDFTASSEKQEVFDDSTQKKEVVDENEKKSSAYFLDKSTEEESTPYDYLGGIEEESLIDLFPLGNERSDEVVQVEQGELEISENTDPENLVEEKFNQEEFKRVRNVYQKQIRHFIEALFDPETSGSEEGVGNLKNWMAKVKNFFVEEPSQEYIDYIEEVKAKNQKEKSKEKRNSSERFNKGFEKLQARLQGLSGWAEKTIPGYAAYTSYMRKGKKWEKLAKRILVSGTLGAITGGGSLLVAGGYAATRVLGGAAAGALAGVIHEKATKKGLERRLDEINRWKGSQEDFNEARKRLIARNERNNNLISAAAGLLGGFSLRGVDIFDGLGVDSIKGNIDPVVTPPETIDETIDEHVKETIDETIDEHVKETIDETTKIKNIEDIFVQKGEGVTNALLRQIDKSTELQEYLGLSEGYTKNELIEAAKKAAEKTGYMSADNEIRVRFGEGAGYELRLEDGKLVVQEYEDIKMSEDGSYEGGSQKEIHHEGDAFEGDGYERNREYLVGTGALEIDTTEIGDSDGVKLDSSKIVDTYDGVKLDPSAELKGEFIGETIDGANITETLEVSGAYAKDPIEGRVYPGTILSQEKLGGAFGNKIVPQAILDLFENPGAPGTFMQFDEKVLTAMGLEKNTALFSRNPFKFTGTGETLGWKEVYEHANLKRIKEIVSAMKG